MVAVGRDSAPTVSGTSPRPTSPRPTPKAVAENSSQHTDCEKPDQPKRRAKESESL
ncbi:hypothetical protein Pla52n_17100 [Stieleria varia]|uniref:Uncharacterized protein n=1 Tax=Stieleria varia TaxID=2528005 RepID=A0A5C6B661_9BACT|nr:hypothetical protein Pla52n_17100 [Stieleria varia]